MVPASYRISRRKLLAGLPAAAAALRGAADERPKLKVAIFSKHLQFVQGEDLARAAGDLGFDGVDITVRKGGHVLPERVREDLPRLVATLRKQPLAVPMITTDIVDADTPHAEDIVATMAELGIPYYRWGGLKYTENQPYTAQLEAMKPRIARLGQLNSRYKVCAMYHTHSGTGVVGASIWDLHILLNDFDPRAVGVNFDVGHAVIEGGLGGWINSFHITGPHLRGIAVKDFAWAKDSKGTWKPEWKPLGEGMVPFSQFFRMVAQAGFAGPLQLHFEYPLSTREETYAAMRHDLATLRGYLAEAGI